MFNSNDYIINKKLNTHSSSGVLISGLYFLLLKKNHQQFKIYKRKFKKNVEKNLSIYYCKNILNLSEEKYLYMVFK